MTFPEDLKYTKEHEWVSIKDGVATIGITEHAQSELGEIVYVEIETVGEDVLINEDPYGEGWIIKIEIADQAEATELLSAADYTNLIS